MVSTETIKKAASITGQMSYYKQMLKEAEKKGDKDRINRIKADIQEFKDSIKSTPIKKSNTSRNNPTPQSRSKK